MLSFIKNYLSDLKLQSIPYKYLLSDTTRGSVKLKRTSRTVDFYLVIENKEIYVGHYYPTTGEVFFKFRGSFEKDIYEMFKEFSESYIKAENEKKILAMDNYNKDRFAVARYNSSKSNK